MTEGIPTGGFTITCTPLPPDLVPRIFEFDVGLDQRAPTCKECFTLMNDVYDFCHERSPASQYCPCVRRAFAEACAQYEGQMKRKCKEAKPIPMSRVGTP